MTAATPPSAMQNSEILWAPKRQSTLAQAHRHSKIVKYMRYGFAAAAFLSVGVLVGHLTANAIANSGSGIRTVEAEQVVTMVNPRFTGRDSAGAQFIITADSAQRHRMDEGVVDLINPTLIDPKGSRVMAPSGLYNQSTQTLELYEDVRVTEASGYKFNTVSARIFVVDGRIEGLEPLTGTGPLGDVRSDTYDITDNGDIVHLEGNVQMILFPDGRDIPVGPGDPYFTEGELENGNDG